MSRTKKLHKSRFRWIARLLRARDRRKERESYTTITPYQWMLYLNNQQYREGREYLRYATYHN